MGLQHIVINRLPTPESGDPLCCLREQSGLVLGQNKNTNSFNDLYSLTCPKTGPWMTGAISKAMNPDKKHSFQKRQTLGSDVK